MAEFERNTTGFTADVEMYDDGTLAKIYRDEIPDEDVQREICPEQGTGRTGIPRSRRI